MDANLLKVKRALEASAGAQEETVQTLESMQELLQTMAEFDDMLLKRIKRLEEQMSEIMNATESR